MQDQFPCFELFPIETHTFQGKARPRSSQLVAIFSQVGESRPFSLASSRSDRRRRTKDTRGTFPRSQPSCWQHSEGQSKRQMGSRVVSNQHLTRFDNQAISQLLGARGGICCSPRHVPLVRSVVQRPQRRSRQSCLIWQSRSSSFPSHQDQAFGRSWEQVGAYQVLRSSSANITSSIFDLF